mmetsp:Transcript_2976/g.5634  ORF Transcript_2976/g.5634 Transcript_2976/m.5634 type:complete len:133 (-) Transcript_2976:301-699(-)
MDDPALEAIRQKRMAELGGASGMGGMDPSSQAAQAQEQEAKKAAMEEQRTTMLQQVLQPAARERLSRISLVKPEKARKVEDMILSMASRGQIGERVSENQLIGWLEQINEKSETKTKVVVSRRRNIMDDDDW